MTKEDHITYWCESAQHYLEASESMLETVRYDWCLFVGHLALEKTIKAIFVDRNDNNMPPRIHNLVRLAEISAIELDGEQKILLDKIRTITLSISSEIEVIPFSPNEFAMENPFVKHILKTGIKLV